MEGNPVADSTNTSDNKTGASFAELGCTGLTRFGNFVHEEWLSELRGAAGAKKYQEMSDNDPTIGAFLFAMKMLIRQVEWTVEAGGDSAVDVEAKEFIESIMKDMQYSWKDTVSEILSFLTYGWSYFEIVYKLRNGANENDGLHSDYDDGKIGVKKLSIRTQTSLNEWGFSEDGDITGMWQTAAPKYIRTFIPIEKAILFRTEITKNNPEGRSILRNSWRPYYFKKNMEEIEGIGVERDLAGLPVMEVPANIMSADATAAEKAMYVSCQQVVQQIRRDEAEGLVIPAAVDQLGQSTGYKLSLLASGGKRSFDTSAIIDRYDKRIAMTVMADFLLLGQKDVGSFALSSDKTKLFTYALVSILDIVEAGINKKLVKELLRLNGYTSKLEVPPKIKHGDIEIPDLGILSAFITSLSGAGLMYPDEDLEAYVRKIASFPPRKPNAKPVPTIGGDTTTRNTNPNLQQSSGVGTEAYSQAKQTANASMNKNADVVDHILAALQDLDESVRKELLNELQNSETSENA